MDGLQIEDIIKLKLNVYNNLSSCYLKSKNYENVIYLCKKIVEREKCNIKALYKLGTAYADTGEYELACSMLKKVLDIDPNNKAAAEKYRYSSDNFAIQVKKCNDMFKKMFK